MLGLDAAEITLVERWMADGSMPNLERLRRRGRCLRLDSPAKHFVGSPWPSFYTSQSPAEHGMYHFLVWRPDQLTTSRPSRSWLPLKPFWRCLARDGKRVVAIDVPQAYAPQAHPGLELSGWATHEILEPPASQPPDLLDWVTGKFGRPPFDDEASHRLSIADALAARDQCIETTRRVAGLCAELMRRETWDLFLVCFAALHRAGHQLWDRTSLAGNPTEAELEAFDDALRRVYAAADEAIGELVEHADEDTAILVFSLHGMGPNTSRTELTKAMLDRILGVAGDRAAPTKPATDRLRGMLPIRLRSWVKNRLPIALQDRLTLYWRLRGIDWSRTRAFAAFGDLDAYIRINLRGREAQGIVEPGAEYGTLCRQIAAGFLSFADEDTGEPVVADVEFAHDAFPRGERRHHLPDLIVHWAPSSAAHHRRLVSPQFGGLDWPTPGYHPQGRSGDHAREGFLIAANLALPESLRHATVLDLAPSVYSLLGVEPPAGFDGRSLVATRDGA
ncbi:MAG: alkaline phosphatase family protein [Pseudomonadota bacterium]